MTTTITDPLEATATNRRGEKLHVAYMLHRFPYLTETFIMRELYWLREQEVDIEIFSLLPPKHEVQDKEAQTLLEHTHYSPYFSWNVFRAQLNFIRRMPGKYLRSLAKVIWQTYREPLVLLRALLLFPKSVYFARRIEQLGIDHIHTHFVWIEGLAAGIASDLLRITFTIHPHAFGLFGRNQTSVRREVESATEVVTISEYHRRYIDELCPGVKPQSIHVVYCGLDTDCVRPTSRSGRNDPLRIVSVGRLMEKKGFQYLIDACAHLAQKGISFECSIAGTGPLKEGLQSAIVRHGLQSRVKLLGALPQHQVLHLYHQSDIFVLPCVVAQSGDRDGIPVVLMEAMACELPVVTTPLSGIPDLVQDGQTGLLVESRNSEALADAIERLLGDESLREELSRRGRQIVQRKFHVRRNVAKLAQIFRRLGGKASESIAQPSVDEHSLPSAGAAASQTCAATRNLTERVLKDSIHEN